MSLINLHNPNDPIANECCICGGTTTVMISGSAYIVVRGREIRVHYHKTCLTDETKKIVTKKLNDLAQLP